MSDTEAFRNIPNGPILGSDACMRDRGTDRRSGKSQGAPVCDYRTPMANTNSASQGAETPRLYHGGVRGLLITTSERLLARAARFATRGKGVLYHGTRYAGQILKKGDCGVPSLDPASFRSRGRPRWQHSVPWCSVTTRSMLRRSSFSIAAR